MMKKLELRGQRISAALFASVLRKPEAGRVYYICGKEDWSIRNDGENIIREIQIAGMANAQLRTGVKGIVHSLVHFGSLPLTAGGVNNPWSQYNHLVSTVFHGDFGINENIDRNLEAFLNNIQRIDCVVASCSIMAERLARWGVPNSKIRLIPLGVDLQRCIAVRRQSRERLRMEHGIQDDEFCIGSWQKDGCGWGEGMEPKWIKGPDILVETLAEVQARGAKIVVILTGPARGYVKDELSKHGVRYIHKTFHRRGDLLSFMGLSDMCIVTSREEGGPKAILEAMALNVPVVSTAVGMAPDIIEDGVNGFLRPIGDVGGLAEATYSIYGNRNLASSLAIAAFDTVQQHDWRRIANRYMSDLYVPLLSSR